MGRPRRPRRRPRRPGAARDAGRPARPARAAPVTALAVTWWGHASATVELAGLRVATDPLHVRRLLHLVRHGPLPAAPAYVADLVVLSHLHLDHLHVPTLRRMAPGSVVLVPRGGESLVPPGHDVRPVVPGEEVVAAGARVQVLPADHDGRRLPGSSLRGPALGFRIEHREVSLWYPGDTGPRQDLAGVGAVDLALVPVGGWGPTLGAGHLDPDQAAAAVTEVGARWAVPVHWGTFWPAGLRRLDRRTHERLFITPGARFAAALGPGPPAPVVLAPGERVQL
ncbi:MBL fold metallo-hydrolase [Nocardioides sp. zg-579]|uniref:MBL fold metallo-hydrolase n=1 Tax=Nocardioides marmotae TaxID=2663857 RepID=A0A6I3JE86_9ACTN|nr:MBL fold metallo-hydrolase [Gordonia jinghuaiqii]MTB96318.1 MBL fold metallo-hydrolase [Nocardioides marmotae]